MKKKTLLKLLFIFQFIFIYTISNSQNFLTYTDPRDKHVYKTVKIGTQIWLAENLAYLPQVDPVSAGTVETGDKVPRYYLDAYTGNDIKQAKLSKYYLEYGVLYNWAAAKLACPPGWHLPSDEEWKKLERFLGMPDALLNEKMYREDGKVGDQLKSKKQWKDFGPDNLGFGALPGGFRHGFNPADPHGAGIIFVGKEALFWTSTAYGENVAWRRQIVTGTHGLVRFPNYMECGYSVRCIKDN